MRFIDEYRSREAVEDYLGRIRAITRHEWTLMEICGGQTHSIVKYGLEAMLPKQIGIVHGPGCPVCVTPLEMIDKAIAIASMPPVIFTSFGDMLRVPGSHHDLLTVKANGGDVRTVYSPLDAVRIACQFPGRQVVFFAIGFETTAPANAVAVLEARRRGLKNFSVLCSQVLVPPAITALLSSGANRIQGILAAGHVCTVMGYEEYVPLAERFHVPIVVTGFEPADLLHGMWLAIKQMEEGRAGVENAYGRAVRREGNPVARRHMEEVFEVTDRAWRGIGVIPMSGYRLRAALGEFDAERRFRVGDIVAEEPAECIAGSVLQGLKKPTDCPAFGARCTPEHPLGAPMVSPEGACAAYYHYRRIAGAPVTGGK